MSGRVGVDEVGGSARQEALESVALEVAQGVRGDQRAAVDASERVESVVEAILASLDELEMLIGVAKNEFAEEREEMIPFFQAIAEKLQQDYRQIDQVADRINALQQVVEHMEEELVRVEKGAAGGAGSLKVPQVDISEKLKLLQTSVKGQSTVVKTKMKGVTEKGVSSFNAVKDQVSQSEQVQKMKELGKKNLTDMKAKGSKFFKMLKTKSSGLVKKDEAEG